MYKYLLYFILILYVGIYLKTWSTSIIILTLIFLLTTNKDSVALSDLSC